MILITVQELYSELATIRHVQSLNYSRATSTPGEYKAASYIMEELEKNNIKSKLEYFGFKGPIRVLVRLFYILFISYLIVYRLYLILAVFFIVKNLSRKLRAISFVSKDESKNIYTLIPASNKAENKRPLIIFTAHYDSVSSIIPNRIQEVLVLLFKVLIIPNILTAVVIFFYVFFNLYNQIIFFIVIFSSVSQIILMALIVLLVYDVEKSCGSIDNASGVSILIELSKVLAKNPLQNIDVLFLWPGAEEWGNKGSKHFCFTQYDELVDKYNLNNSCNINIDMVGSYIGLADKFGIIRKKSMNKNLNNLIEESSKKLEIPLVVYSKRLEPRSDQRSFRLFEKKTKGNFQVCCFHSEKDSKYIHSLKDTPDRCSTANLNGCLNICYETILKLDSQAN